MYDQSLSMSPFVAYRTREQVNGEAVVYTKFDKVKTRFHAMRERKIAQLYQ